MAARPRFGARWARPTTTDPAAFIDALAAAQAADLRAVAARGGGAPGGGAGVAMAGAAVFAGDWVDEAVGRMLARRAF